MGLRFNRRVQIIPGLRVNLSRSGPSLSIGHRGAWYTVGPRGRRVTVGLPAAGLYWTEKVSPAARSMAAIGRRSSLRSSRSDFSSWSRATPDGGQPIASHSRPSVGAWRPFRADKVRSLQVFDKALSDVS